jgi:polyhydroxyalkanoate synthase
MEIARSWRQQNWNADNTRMPAKMHSFYLRSFYQQNQLARGELEVLGERLALSDIKNSTYIVGAINDHIVPWPSSYKSVHLLGGDVRFILSSGGHIAGIVNPPTRRGARQLRPAVDAASLARRHFRQRRFLVGGLDGLVHGPRGRSTRRGREVVAIPPR